MPKSMPEEELKAIEGAVAACSGGGSLQEIESGLAGRMTKRTLQNRLKYLVEAERLVMEGTRRWARYRLPGGRVGEQQDASGEGGRMPRSSAGRGAAGEGVQVIDIPLSPDSLEIRRYLERPVTSRKPVAYKREFLDSYQPNVSAYLSEDERERLEAVGVPDTSEQPAGTFAKRILNRLLIDLSWNSSRMEGNTYSMLETKRLIEFGEIAQGKEATEAVMILNHKDAIEYLVEASEDIVFSRNDILNLHALLADNLLPDPAAVGRLRRIEVTIGQSQYHPPAIPQLVEECFEQILATAVAIENPFEQAFFIMVQLPYLQPFEDVNKRVSRLAANIPLIKTNRVPLSFVDVPAALYLQATLGVYEMNRVDMLKDVFLWAYERSAERYKVVRQTLGDPDPFRLRHHVLLKDIVRSVVIDGLGRKAAYARIATYAEEHVASAEAGQFREVAEDEVLALHEGSCARYQVTPAQFREWQEGWNGNGNGSK